MLCHSNHNVVSDAQVSLRNGYSTNSCNLHLTDGIDRNIAVGYLLEWSSCAWKRHSIQKIVIVLDQYSYVLSNFGTPIFGTGSLYLNSLYYAIRLAYQTYPSIKGDQLLPLLYVEKTKLNKLNKLSTFVNPHKIQCSCYIKIHVKQYNRLRVE